MPVARVPINLLDWQHWPYSSYASHHPSEFVNMATIHADPDAPALEETGNDPFGLGTLKIALGQGPSLALPDALKTVQMKGFAVMHGGKLVFETYGSGMQKHDMQILQSSSKTFTGMLIHKLASEGLLDLAANVQHYLPDLDAGVFSWGMAICLRDAARFTQMMLERGTYDGKRVIPDSYFQSTFDTPLTGTAITSKLLDLQEGYKNNWPCC